MNLIMLYLRVRVSISQWHSPTQRLTDYHPQVSHSFSYFKNPWVRPHRFVGERFTLCGTVGTLISSQLYRLESYLKLWYIKKIFPCTLFDKALFDFNLKRHDWRMLKAAILRRQIPRVPTDSSPWWSGARRTLPKKCLLRQKWRLLL